MINDFGGKGFLPHELAATFTEQCTHKAAKFIKNHPNVENQYANTLQLLEVNPHHASVRLHALKGKLDGLYSVSINLKYRITLTMIITEKEIVLVNVGDHSQVC